MTMFKLHTSPSLFALTLLLSACGGGSGLPAANEPLPVKKQLNTDNVDQGLASYLLLRYRLNEEIPQLLNFQQNINFDSGDTQACPKQGTISRAQPLALGIFDFSQCRNESGIIYSGRFEQHVAVGPVKSNWYDLIDLNFQFNQDSEAQKLSGSYFWSSGEPKRDYYTLNYTMGTQTTRYTRSSNLSPTMEISSTAISGNQHFTVYDRDNQGQAITPVLQADDGSNITISLDAIGQATTVLRNERDGKILMTKVYSKAEVAALLNTARRLKS